MRRLPPDKLKIAETEYQKMLDLGIYRPSRSPWSNPLHMIKKNNGDWRPVGDYRKPNSITTLNRYPVPYIYDFAHFLVGKKIFCSLDLNQTYHQVPVEETSIPKAAIITPFELFAFNRMQFGLRNAAQSFQSFIQETWWFGFLFCIH